MKSAICRSVEKRRLPIRTEPSAPVPQSSNTFVRLTGPIFWAVAFQSFTKYPFVVSEITTERGDPYVGIPRVAVTRNERASMRSYDDDLESVG